MTAQNTLQDLIQKAFDHLSIYVFPFGKFFHVLLQVLIQEFKNEV
jgi:hypothetical protein